VARLWDWPPATQKEGDMHFFKVYETSVSRAIQQVHQFLAQCEQCELRNWFDYTILGTLDINADKFNYNVKKSEGWNILDKRADINKMLTDYVSVENFNKKKKWLLSAIMSGDWMTAEHVCRELTGIEEYAMGRKIDVADLNVPVINWDNMINPGLSKIGIDPGLGSGETAYLVEVIFDA
jgi:hypothetical protein